VLNFEALERLNLAREIVEHELELVCSEMVQIMSRELV
jgi:hypothetical protein